MHLSHLHFKFYVYILNLYFIFYPLTGSLQLNKVCKYRRHRLIGKENEYYQIHAEDVLSICLHKEEMLPASCIALGRAQLVG